ncbi:hypothetical protein OG963_00240 [Streptomyces sp. NBC_01707]|nr:hypothetical protein OG763_43420 [Streptomyces sp. NBC_01230]
MLDQFVEVVDRAEELDLGVHGPAAALAEVAPESLEELGEPRLDQGTALTVLGPSCRGGEAGRHVLLAGRGLLAFRGEACLVGIAGDREQQWEVSEGLEGGGGSVPAVGEPELDVSGESCGLVIVLRLVHHRNEGRSVRGIVVRFDGQQELAASAHNLDVVSLQVAAAFARNQPGVGIAQAGAGLRMFSERSSLATSWTRSVPYEPVLTRVMPLSVTTSSAVVALLLALLRLKSAIRGWYLV